MTRIARRVHSCRVAITAYVSERCIPLLSRAFVLIQPVEPEVRRLWRAPVFRWELGQRSMPSHPARGVRQTFGQDLAGPCGGRDAFRQIAEVRPTANEQ